MRDSIDLVVGSVRRLEVLERLIRSLIECEVRTAVQIHLFIVEQEDVEAVKAHVGTLRGLSRVEVLHSDRGLSRARNVGLQRTCCRFLAFPDDDAWYTASTISNALESLRDSGGIVIGRQVDERDQNLLRSPSLAGDALSTSDIWRVAMSSAIFVDRESLADHLQFDERLGVGSGTNWGAGEETEFVLRCAEDGVPVRYNSNLVVHHPRADQVEGRLRFKNGLKYGRGMGVVHSAYPSTVAARAAFLFRPVVGVLADAVLGRHAVPFRIGVLFGRIAGYMDKVRGRYERIDLD